MSLYPAGTDAAPHPVTVSLACDECDHCWAAEGVAHLGALDLYDPACPECGATEASVEEVE